MKLIKKSVMDGVTDELERPRLISPLGHETLHLPPYQDEVDRDQPPPQPAGTPAQRRLPFRARSAFRVAARTPAIPGGNGLARPPPGHKGLRDESVGPRGRHGPQRSPGTAD
ncbi:UNVERIFIED_CONTAM: hypothetical protein K2H54_003617 [Gekko kuhli]